MNRNERHLRNRGWKLNPQNHCWSNERLAGMLGKGQMACSLWQAIEVQRYADSAAKDMATVVGSHYMDALGTGSEVDYNEWHEEVWELYDRWREDVARRRDDEVDG